MTPERAYLRRKSEMVFEKEQKEAVEQAVANIATFVNNECRKRAISTYMLSKLSGVSFYAVKSIRAGRIQPLDRIVRVVVSLGGNMIIV